MEIRALNASFEPVGMTKIKYFDLMWNRKYYESGSFSVQIMACDYLPDMSYIYTSERPELGMVQSIEYSDDGNMVVLSGFFYEKKLADKIVYPVYNGIGTPEEIAREIVSTYKSDIPKISLGESTGTGTSVTKQETGGNLDEVVSNLLMTEEKAYRCRYDYIADTVYFDVWQGVDRTQSQSENNFVTFSKGFRNLTKVKTKDDCSNFKNYAVVAGSGQSDERIYQIVDLSDGKYQKQIFVDCRNEKYNPSNQTLAEYKAALYQKGIEKLQSYVDIHNIEFDALANSGFVYLEDYDLGDKCDIIVEDVQRSYEARIIEICETWNKGIHTVTLTFGDKIPTKYEKARIK